MIGRYSMSHKIVIMKYIEISFQHDAQYTLLYVYAKFQVEMSYGLGYAALSNWYTCLFQRLNWPPHRTLYSFAMKRAKKT